MAELGKIQAQKRIACPNCRALLPDWTPDEMLAGVHCPECRQPVQLPEEVLERARRSRYLGRSLDITG